MAGDTDERLPAAVDGRAGLAEHLFAELAHHTADGIGITRASYGSGEQLAHDLARQTAGELGLETATDAAGNLYMTLPGGDRAAPRIIVGSHLDSVAHGGNYDGAAGVVAGLVALAALNDAGITPPQDVTVMAIRAEESVWFGISYIGSRGALGLLPADALDTARRCDTGRTLGQHIDEAGFDAAALRRGEAYLRRNALRAYLELHIEQGPVLEARDIPVGIVTGVRGNIRYKQARCIGAYAHCGGVPRADRRDAVMAASALVTALDDAWREIESAGGDIAVTVGEFHTDPDMHAITKIAGEVRFTLDLRSQDPKTLRDIDVRLHRLAEKIGVERKVAFDLGPKTQAPMGPVDPEIRRALVRGTQELGIPAIEMPSGASHDAAAFADAGLPMAMIFVRNAHGSHNPDEAMALSDFLQATRLLAWWLARTA